MALSYAQSRMLEKVPSDWQRMTVGCTNRTAEALEKQGLIETRISKQLTFGLSEWEWRKVPQKNLRDMTEADFVVAHG